MYIYVCIYMQYNNPLLRYALPVNLWNPESRVDRRSAFRSCRSILKHTRVWWKETKARTYIHVYAHVQ